MEGAGGRGGRGGEAGAGAAGVTAASGVGTAVLPPMDDGARGGLAASVDSDDSTDPDLMLL